MAHKTIILFWDMFLCFEEIISNVLEYDSYSKYSLWWYNAEVFYGQCLSLSWFNVTGQYLLSNPCVWGYFHEGDMLKHPVILMFRISKFNSKKTCYVIMWELINLIFTELLWNLFFYHRRYLLLTYGGYSKNSISLLLLPDSRALSPVPSSQCLLTASFGNPRWSEGIFAVSVVLPPEFTR